MMPEEKISRLLRLKRHERPPEGYFDEFLREFQARQRAEVLRRPLWQIISDRILSMSPTFEVPRMAYGALAAAAVVAIAAIIVKPTADPSRVLAATSSLTLSPSRPVSIGESQPVVLTSTGTPSVHYVLPTRPVSYASARSF